MSLLTNISFVRICALILTLVLIPIVLAQSDQVPRTNVSGPIKETVAKKDTRSISPQDSHPRQYGQQKNWMDVINPMDILQLLEIHDWTRHVNLTGSCQQDMEVYVQGLRNFSIWAVKMLDASGRYDGSLFQGSNLWLGSAALCKRIDESEEYYNKHIKGTPEDLEETRPRQYVTFEKRIILENDPSIKWDIPPFRLMFSTVLFKMTFRNMHEIQFITNALCWPISCDSGDVLQMANFLMTRTHHDVLPRDVQILKVRQLDANYDYWSDIKFVVLVIITSIVVVFICIGTYLERHLKNQEKKSKSTSCPMTRNGPLDANGNFEQNSKRKDSMINIEGNMTTVPRSKPSNVRTTWEKIFLAFSLSSNSKKICSTSIANDTLLPIHGLRTISLMWVVLVHTCLFIFHMSDNKKFRDKEERENVFYQTVNNASYSVDTFFFIGGVLVSYLFYTTLSKKGAKTETLQQQCMTYAKMISYRFVRLTPPYLYVIVLTGIFMKYHKSASVFELPSQDDINCDKYWWRNILYINTFFPNDQMCMTWSWYLSNDTQFYAVGSLILLISVKNKNIAAMILGVLLLISWVMTTVISISLNYIPSTADPFSHYDQLYDKPWTRFGPYFFGFICGYMLYKTNCDFKLTRRQVAGGWFACLFALAFVIYSIYYIKFGVFTSALYMSLSHSLWALGIAWILFASVSGKGGFLSKVLCCKYILPISRLTYCAYLIHPVIIRKVLLNNESPFHLTRSITFVYYIGFLILSYAAAFILSVAFEAPVVNLLHFNDKKVADDSSNKSLGHENEAYHSKD